MGRAPWGGTISVMADEYGLRRPERAGDNWTREDEERLVRVVGRGVLGRGAIADLLQRSTRAIDRRAWEMLPDAVREKTEYRHAIDALRHHLLHHPDYDWRGQREHYVAIRKTVRMLDQVAGANPADVAEAFGSWLLALHAEGELRSDNGADIAETLAVCGGHLTAARAALERAQLCRVSDGP